MRKYQKEYQHSNAEIECALAGDVLEEAVREEVAVEALLPYRTEVVNEFIRVVFAHVRDFPEPRKR